MNGARIRLIGGAIALLAVLAGGWFLGAAPFLAAARAADGEIASVAAVNAVHEARLATLQAAAADSTAIQRDFTELTAAIPGDSGLTAFVGRMSADASAAGVALTSLTAADSVLLADAVAVDAAAPVEEATEAPVAGTDPASMPASPFAPGLVMIPVDIAASGDLAALRAFVSRIQDGDRLITISALTFVEAGEGGGYTLALTGTLYLVPVTG